MPRMVSKPSGSQSQSSGSRRHHTANETTPNVDQRGASGQMDPPRSGPPRRSASSSVERSSARGATGTTRTLPANVQQHGKSTKGSSSKPPGSQSQSLPGHAARVPTEGSRRPPRETSHRANPHGQSAPAQPTSGRARASNNVMNVRVEVNQERPNPTRERRPAPTAAASVRQSQSLPGHASGQTQVAQSPAAGANEARHQQGSRKPSAASKDPKERYLRQTQMKQAATLPSGGTSTRSAASRSRPGDSLASNAQTQSRTTPSSSSRPSAPSGQQQSSSSRDSQGPSQVTVSSLGNQDQRRERSQDIARITVDARGVINRTPSSSNNQDVPHTGVASGQQSQQTPHPPVHRQPNRNLPQSSDRTNRDVQSHGNTINSHRTERSRVVDPSSLHLDIVNLNQQDQGASNHPSPSSAHILTNNLNAGVSVNRPERPEINEALPDILNSHVLPPYTVRQNQHRPSRQNNQRSRSSQNRSRRQNRNQPGVTQIDDEEKGCCTHEGCLSCLTILTTFRWVLVSLALLGVLCVITGIILGALHMTVGSSYLTLSLMFIGLGVMLVIVVGVGWKCTPPGHEPCHLLFNLGEHCTRDVSSSRRRHRERNHWYGGVSYPEFRYRRPPPSYNASMQEYQQQLMLAQLQMNNGQPNTGQPNNNNPDNNGPPHVCQADLPPSYVLEDNYSLPSSPPPSYKSRASTIRPGLHITFPPHGDDYPNSRPPTYRSRAGTGHRPALNLGGNESGGFDNPACSDTEPPSSSSDSSRRLSDATTLESAGNSTLHRVDQVVGYLDNVLEDHDRTLEYNIPRSSRSEPRDLVADGTKAGVSGSNPETPIEDVIRIRDTPL